MKTGLTLGVFEKQKFAPYEYREFPKQIALKTKQKGSKHHDFVVVNNAREEAALLTERYDDLIPQVVDPLVEERNSLAQTVAKQQALVASMEKELAELRASRMVDAPTGAPSKAKGTLSAADISVPKA